MFAGAGPTVKADVVDVLKAVAGAVVGVIPDAEEVFADLLAALSVKSLSQFPRREGSKEILKGGLSFPSNHSAEPCSDTFVIMVSRMPSNHYSVDSDDYSPLPLIAGNKSS